jgi:hypothetical protein
MDSSRMDKKNCLLDLVSAVLFILSYIQHAIFAYRTYKLIVLPRNIQIVQPTDGVSTLVFSVKRLAVTPHPRTFTRLYTMATIFPMPRSPSLTLAVYHVRNPPMLTTRIRMINRMLMM